MPKPEKSFKCGGCEAAVFRNEIVKGGKTTIIKKVVFQKRYKNSNGEWDSTHSLDTNDLPKASLVLSKAYEYLVSRSTDDSSSDSDD